MKFDCGLTKEDKDTANQCWHPWFAWRPVKVGPRDCRWLEVIGRKGTVTEKNRHDQYGHYTYTIECWSWEYRAR